MNRTCAICGEEFPEAKMEKISPSPSHPQYLCWECYKLSIRENYLGDLRRANKFSKIKENRKVK